MSPIRSLSASQSRAGFSRIDLLTVGLMLLIILAISLPCFYSAGKGVQKQVSRPTTSLRSAAVIGSLR